MDEVRDERPVFRDIRRYYCEYCGICRSKKSLIASHILTDHKDEMENVMAEGYDGTEGLRKSNTCEICGVTFKKPAYLKQHMQSHSLERPYTCSVDDCCACYRRKDHLTRHLLSHKVVVFKCSVESCDREFSVQQNLTKHVKEDHMSPEAKCQKQHVCQEVGCGKAFKYVSKLQKHEDSHVKLESIETVCAEPGCMKFFSNKQCLKEHIQLCHQHVTCDVCGAKHLRKNIKRHLRSHEENRSIERVKCNYKGCDCSFSTESNLNQHVKAVHLKLKPFVCSVSGCGMRFSYKHVRDNHEKTGCHVHVHGDFVESDEQFQSRPRGGCKRKYPTVEMLIRKRITPPNLFDGSSESFSAFFSDQDS